MTTIAPSWNLDVAGAQRLEPELEAAEGAVEVELTDVAFVASSGLRVLLKHAQRLDKAGGSLVITNPSDMVREVLDMSGFSTILEVR